MYSDQFIDPAIVEKARAVRSARRLNPHWKELHNQKASPDLSNRELDVLHGITYGMGNVEIGEMLGITKATVMSHVKSILAKFGAKNRAHAVALAYINGVLEV